MLIGFLLRGFASKYKLKSHSGLKKRIRITGELWDRHFNYYPTGKRHLMVNKSKNNLARKKGTRELTASADVRRLKKLLPYWNFSKIKRFN